MILVCWSCFAKSSQTVTVITVDHKIYLFGGRNTADKDLNQVLCFDPLTSQWIALANMPTARHAQRLFGFKIESGLLVVWLRL